MTDSSKEDEATDEMVKQFFERGQRFAKQFDRMQRLQKIKVGDTVTRIMAGIPMKLKVTAVDDFIHCGPWKFSRRNGAEIDEEIGFSEKLTGSFLQFNDENGNQNDAT